MHQCLAIQELLRVIFAFARTYHPNDWKDDRTESLSLSLEADLRTLRECALACRTFLEPALDELWREQHGLDALIKLLPEDIWAKFADASGTAHGCGGDERTLRTQAHTVDQMAWTRFDYYARRLKMLDLTDSHASPDSEASATVPSSFVFALRSRGFSCFPSLDELLWSPDIFREECLPCLDILLGPMLTALQLSSIPDGPLWRMEQISRSCPRLKILSLVIDHIADEGPFAGTTNLPMQPVTFPCLLALGLFSDAAIACSTFLEKVRLPMLRQFAVTVDHGLDMARLFSLIDISGMKHTLRSIEISLLRPTSDDQATFTLSELEALESIPNLASLMLDNISISDLTDETVKHFADRFPRLECLALFIPPLDIYQPKVTLLGIAALAKACPRLCNLDVPFDVMKPITLDSLDSSYQNANTRQVRHAFLGEGAPGLKIDGLKRLKKVFPNLGLEDVEWYQMYVPIQEL